jgi:hypothetical protein
MNGRIFTPSIRQTLQRAAFVGLAISSFAIAACGIRTVVARHKIADLQIGVTGRKKRLREDRVAASQTPKNSSSVALSRSQAVSKLRSALSKIAAQKGISVDEFQASTDEMPYLTVYSTDSNDSGWTQVSVRFSLSGSCPKLASSLAELRALDAPFEVDNIEFTRRSTDTFGKSLVAEQVQMRVLVYRGQA